MVSKSNYLTCNFLTPVRCGNVFSVMVHWTRRHERTASALHPCDRPLSSQTLHLSSLDNRLIQPDKVKPRLQEYFHANLEQKNTNLWKCR